MMKNAIWLLPLIVAACNIIAGDDGDVSLLADGHALVNGFVRWQSSLQPAVGVRVDAVCDGPTGLLERYATTDSEGWYSLGIRLYLPAESDIDPDTVVFECDIYANDDSTSMVSLPVPVHTPDSGLEPVDLDLTIRP